MRIHARTALAVLAAAAAIVTAGCGGSGSATPAASSPAAASPSDSATSGAPAASPTSSSGPQAQGAGRCHTSMLSAHVRLGSPGAGQRYAFLVLTNTSSLTCRIFGYPGMQLLTASGGNVATKVIRTTPEPRLVTVVPGGHVYSLLHWTVVPAGDEASPCEPLATMAHVTPPDETAPLTTAWPGGSVCQHGRIYVTPLRPGTGM